MKKDLYLMRHGETLFNIRRKIQGWCDSPLTEAGIAQARAAGECLKEISFDHFYCSTAERCSDTLEIVMGERQHPYTRLKGLKERYFGPFEGESEDLNPPFESYDAMFSLFGGETGQQVTERMVKTLTDVMNQEDHQTVLAISHAGASMSFLSAWADPAEVLKGVRFSNCHILHFSYEDGQFQFIELIQPNI